MQVVDRFLSTKHPLKARQALVDRDSKKAYLLIKSL